MRIILTRAAIALALAGTTLGSAVTANAAGVTFDIGNVAVVNSDGYRGNDQRYYRWARASDAKRFRTAHKDQYHAYRHDDKNHHD